MFEKTALEGMWKIVRNWGVCEKCEDGGDMWVCVRSVGMCGDGGDIGSV